jgi:anthranilate phosphoribosyltransferase
MADEERTPAPGPPEFRHAAGSSALTAAIRRLLDGETLSAPDASAAFQAIMTGSAHHGEIGALLALLATRVPTADEILGAASVMRAHVERVPTSIDPERLLDTAGTGGAPKTFNVSTAAAIIATAAGRGAFAVAKHGNRSRTGRGSAEVLLALGVNVDANRATQAQCLDAAHICFCFAVHHHPAARHAMPVRLALGFPTIFNLLGPLTNPAGARRQLMGVYDRRLLRPIAEALAALGATRAIVVHSDDGLDELSISASSHLMHVENGRVRDETIEPAAFGLDPEAGMQAVTARDLDHAASMIRGVIEGELRGPPRHMAVLNAAAALLAAGAGDSLLECMHRAGDAIDSGHASDTLRALVEVSNAGDGDH